MALKTIMLRKKLNAKLAERQRLQARADELEQAVEAAAEVDPDLEAQVNEVANAQTDVEAAIQTLTEAIAAEEEAAAAAIETAIDTDPAEAGGSETLPDALASIRPSTRERSTRSMSNNRETRAAEFQRTGRRSVRDVRGFIRSSVLSSSTGVIGPTGVDGINDLAGPRYSSIVDMVKITDATGMASYKVAYVAADTAAASSITEGSAPTEAEPTFGSVTFTPANYGVLGYVSKEIRKQSPLNYEEKVTEQSRISLRKKMASVITSGILSSALNDSVLFTAAAAATKGDVLFDAKLLSSIILSYGGDEGVDGSAVLFLAKEDLMAFAAVRGTNEYLPVYSIKPDESNPNVGIIQDNNGLSCRYCINSNVKALSTLELSSSQAKPSMIYGNPICCEVPIWGDYEVEVNDGYKFAEGLLTVRGEITAAAAPVVKGGFVIIQGNKAAS